MIFYEFWYFIIFFILNFSSIGVLLFEQTIDPPIINGLSVFKEHYEEFTEEEKNNILKTINLSISCPSISKLTSITLALVKMLRSDKLIDLILNVIRKNLFNNTMNKDHSVVSKHKCYQLFFKFINN